MLLYFSQSRMSPTMMAAVCTLINNTLGVCAACYVEECSAWG